MTHLERPHKSTSHEEMFFHFQEPVGPYKGATVFCRKEGEDWYAAVAFCSPRDPFVKRIGRSQARRRYFLVMQHSEFPYAWLESLGPQKPSYDDVRLMAMDMATNPVR